VRSDAVEEPNPMPLDPEHPTPRPGRIILPGDEHTSEPPADPAGEDSVRDAGPRIILPPGVEVAEHQDLPEYPRLRPLTISPVRDGDRDLIVVNDPLGVLPAPVALRMEALDLLQLLDGRTSLTDLVAAVVRASKDIRSGTYVKDFVAELDRMLLLDSPRFEAAYQKVRDAYHQLEIRQAMFWGLTYPEAPEDAAKFVDGHFAGAQAMREKAGEPAAAPDAVPRSLLAPHLDPRRAGDVIARAWLEVGEAPAGPLRVIIVGVGHMLFGDRFALTRKHFETPFGRVDCDVAFVDAIVARVGEDVAYHGELAHRDEHSIEFQTLYLKRRLGERPVTIVPILVGGFHGLLDQGQGPRDDASLEALIAAVRETAATAGGNTIVMSAVDLSHVGTRFGDPALDDRTLKEVEAFDLALVERARRGDADAWHEAIAGHDDATRVCGWGAAYTALRIAEPGVGRTLRYEQSREDDGSMVSVATIAWP
jgi:AmmeMemoRadiSam system protein B